MRPEFETIIEDIKMPSEHIEAVTDEKDDFTALAPTWIYYKGCIPFVVKATWMSFISWEHLSCRIRKNADGTTCDSNTITHQSCRKMSFISL